MVQNRVADRMARTLECLKLFTKLHLVTKRGRSDGAVEGSNKGVAVTTSSSKNAVSATDTTVSATSTEFSATSTDVSVTDTDVSVSARARIPRLPIEIIGEISSYMDMDGIKNMRLVCKDFRYATNVIFGKALVANRTLYPTYNSLSLYLNMLHCDPDWCPLVETVTLVSDAPRVHEHGSHWAWDIMEHEQSVNANRQDRVIKHFLNTEHKKFCHYNNFFITTGGYRTLLTMIFSHLENLHTVNVRRIRRAEYVPEFKAAEAIKDLSYYREDLDTRLVFYGDWRYDTLHRRVTTWVDEYGEHMIPDDSGPQVGCMQDVAAALGYTRREVILDLID